LELKQVMQQIARKSPRQVTFFAHRGNCHNRLRLFGVMRLPGALITRISIRPQGWRSARALRFGD
jgi:hypothetical protein